MRGHGLRVVLCAVVACAAGLTSTGWTPARAAQPSASPMHAERASEAHHDTSPPVRDLQGAPTESQSHPALRDRSGRDSGASSGDTSGRPLPGRPGARPRVRVGGIGANGSAPPDNDGAVGATQYVELVNSQFAVYDKSGNTVLAARNTNTIWSGFGGGCQANNDGDGTVLYDAMAGRWVIQQFSVTGSSSTGSPYLDCVAVSTTSDATGSWNRYSFQYTNFPDYPKTGVWPDAYYASFNLFNDAGTSGLGAELCAFNRSAMLAGAAATQQCFMATSSGENTFLPASVDGTTAPPAGEPEHFVALGTTSANALSYVNFHVDWSNTANSSLSAITDLAVTAFSRACNGGGTCVPQSGTSTQLDSLADRLMYRLAYRNFGDHEAMVVNHSVTSGSSVGVRWYELRPSGSALGVYQQGTYAPDATYRWMGSIALDQSGDMALGYSTSSSTTHPGIRYSGRLRADAAGTMSQPETTVITGGGSQTSYNGQRLTRWGDYTEMTVDPVDGCTFWYVNEYIPSNGAFNWATQITSFRYPSCGGTTPPPASNDFSMSANPSSVSTTQGGSATSTIATTVTSGSAQSVSLSASGLPAGATASFAPASVSAGGSSTMTVSTAPTTPAGTSTITVTGTGASATHTTTVSLTVTASAGGGGSVVANGGFESGSLAGWTPGGVLAPVLVASGAHSGTYAAQLGGSSAYNGDSTLQQTIAVPSNGGTLTFWYQPHCPDTITYDQQKAELRSTSGSTLVSMLNVCSNSGAWTQVSQDLSAYKGQSVVLWFGTHDDNYPSDPTSMLLDDVSVGAPAPPPPPPPAGVVVNGGFESGSLSGWTARGASTSVVSGVAHSGTYAARLGSTSPTSGDSTITQTIAVPASGGTLTVWYQPHCPDTLTYDQEQIEVRSTAGTVLATLANVCSNSGTWTKVTQSLSAWAGTSVVIWLNSHDDNYAGDPTYTLFDDISVG